MDKNRVGVDAVRGRSKIPVNRLPPLTLPDALAYTARHA